MTAARAEVRRRAMADHLLSIGAATTTELSERFEVSAVTIHRDLVELERRGVVRRFHGGVTAQPSSTFESLLDYRLNSELEHKQAIAAAALDHVHPGMSVLLDDSTTTLQLVPGLARRTPLTVATNFLRGLRELTTLQRDHDLEVIGIGGRYDPGHDSFGGLHATEQVRAMRVDAAFVSTAAVSATGIYYQGDEIASLKRAMIDSAAATYLLVDHTKLHREALLRVARITEVTMVITDSDADPERLAQWRRAGVACQVADVPTPT
ncbi:DeoR/GlpR family DNA-binding transcription regulator [Propionibacteriaceae bacterium Y2011]|uniref:DeoR/GlpR family DNA-binding transcription regulator n=1 Tax=Microlunatus sp. Y2014 TaxID=3418488 RepID=UPI003B497DAB